MAEPDIQIREYRDGDEAQIVNLLELIFEGWPDFDISGSSLDHWMWKHKDNPYGKSIIATGRMKEEIISCLHYIPIRIKIGSKVVTTGNGTDAAVHKDYRRMGIYSKMRSLLYNVMLNENMYSTCSLDSVPILIQNAERRFPRLPSDVRIFKYIKNPSRYFQSKDRSPLKNLTYNIGYRSLNIFQRLSKRQYSTKEPGNMKLEFSRKFDSSFTDFWKEISDHYEFILIRDMSFMNWRLQDERAGKYIIIQAKENDKLVGYSVLRINRFEPSKLDGYIVDLLAIPHRDDILHELILKSKMFFDNNGVNSVNAMCNKGNFKEKILISHGFVDSRTELRVSLNLFETKKQHEVDFLNDVTQEKIDYQYLNLDWV